MTTRSLLPPSGGPSTLVSACSTPPTCTAAATANACSNAEPVLATLEQLVAEGKIVHYGTSVEAPEMVRAFAAGAFCVTAQQQFNVFGGNQETLELCQRLGLASLCRSPLAMGLLTGKYQPGERLGADDVRAATPYWDYFKPGRMEAWLEQLAAIREVLTAGGRSLAQARWRGYGRAVPSPFPFPASGPSPRPRRTPTPWRSGRPATSRCARSTRCSTSKCGPQRRARGRVSLGGARRTASRGSPRSHTAQPARRARRPPWPPQRRGHRAEPAARCPPTRRHRQTARDHAG